MLGATLTFSLLVARISAMLLEIGLGAVGLIRARYALKDTLASVAMRFGNVGVNILMGATMAAGLAAAYHWRVATIPASSVWAWLVLFVLDDFTYYWFHRVSHRCRIWWAAHVNHHSSREYNLSTAVRQPWTGVIVGTWMPWMWLTWLGFSPEMVIAQQTLNLFYQFWLHTEAVRRLPRWFEYLFNTPSHHRVHHGANPRYLDRNYAGVLMAWDRMFGTFEPERDDEPVEYGLVRNIDSYNPLWIAFHEWIAMARDLRTVRSLREAIGVTFGPPGWRADGRGETTDAMRAAWAARSAAQ
jgi:sterol desaturase/sphingolipid hydroxylase (fatty acid hydroxylase superfamily)